jgi:hypothetical protein
VELSALHVTWARLSTVGWPLIVTGTGADGMIVDPGVYGNRVCANTAHMLTPTMYNAVLSARTREGPLERDIGGVQESLPSFVYAGFSKQKNNLCFL